MKMYLPFEDSWNAQNEYNLFWNTQEKNDPYT